MLTHRRAVVSARVTSCPNCGGQVEFKAGASLLTVCPYCSSAIARVGEDITELEILGKVAPLAELGSPLRLGTTGRHKGKAFELIGRLQLDHGAGPWNEWYARFDDGRWGWVAEAQGKVYLTFPFPAESLPDYRDWPVGRRYRFGGQSYVVVERRGARFVSAEGDLPFAAAPGAQFRYCDLEGDRGGFATLDFGQGSTPESVFIGEVLGYSDLFGKDVLAEYQPKEALAVAHNCPSCGAGVEIKAPGESETITCDRCDSVLDCAKGTELFLLQAAKQKTPAPVIPLGTQGRFRNQKHTVYGYLLRSVVVDGVKYSWEEYLLRGQDREYRWLVCSDGHWLWVEPAARGQVEGEGKRIGYRGRSFRHFQRSSARVDGLRGEFYWKVRVGDVVRMDDYVDPPLMLSREHTSDEVNWSVGEYVEGSELRQAFRLQKLPRPIGIAPASPNPYKAGRAGVLRLALVLTAVYVLLGVGVAACSESRLVYETGDVLQAAPGRPGGPAPIESLSEPFQLRQQSNLEIEATATVSNSWLFVAGDLVNTETGEVRSFGLEVAYYFGSSGGESWSEGGTSRVIHLGEVAPGNYVLQLEASADPARASTHYGVKVRSDVFLFSHWFSGLAVLWVFPLFILFLYASFEKKRWMNSDYAS